MTTQRSGEEEEALESKRQSRWLAATNYILATLGCAVLTFAIWLPKEIGGKYGWEQRERYWQIAAAVALLLAIVTVFRNRNYSLLVLVLSCAFLVASCFDNVKWHGG